MKRCHLKLSVVSLSLITCSTMAAESDFCPGNICKQVWGMESKYQATPLPSNHGSSWIVCDSSGYKFDGNNGVLTVNYSHVQGKPEKTCYIKFDLFSKYPSLQQHGYLTATITVKGNGKIQNRIWPAFWLVGPAWPSFGEIDTAEYMANYVTNVNLNGGSSSPSTNISKTALSYATLGLGDVGQTHTYGIEWKKQADTYLLSFYFDNNRIGSYQLLTNSYPDKAVIKGLNNNNMQIVFDTDDIVANSHNAGQVYAAPNLDYQMIATSVKAYTVDNPK